MAGPKPPAKISQPLWKRHSLSLAASGVLVLWLVLYLGADPKSRAGSFYGNAIADWTGVVITILATKYFFEKGSRESKQPKIIHKNHFLELLHEHSFDYFPGVNRLGLGGLVPQGRSREQMGHRGQQPRLGMVAADRLGAAYQETDRDRLQRKQR